MSKHYKHYRSRPKVSAEEDIAWLRAARDAFKKADEAVFAPGFWPLRTRSMDRVIRAMGVIQHTLHIAIDEAHQASSGAPLRTRYEGDWLGYPPPRR